MGNDDVGEMKATVTFIRFNEEKGYPVKQDENGNYVDFIDKVEYKDLPVTISEGEQS